MKSLIMTAILVLLCSRANAEPVATYEQNLQSSTSLSLDQGGDDIPFVYLPAFNEKLGTLKAVQLGLTLSIFADFTDKVEIPNPPPTSVNFTFGLSLSYGGLYSSAPIVESVVPFSDALEVSAAANANFSQLFFASTLSPFETNCSGPLYCDTSFYVDPSVITTIDNAYTQDFENVSFDLSETFYYTPATAISEPGSTGLLLVGCVASIAIARCRGRKAWSFCKRAVF